MRRYLLHVLIISFIFLLAPTAQVATYAGESQNELIESCREAVRESPDYFIAHFALGGAYHGAGRFEEAIRSFKMSIKLNPDFASAYTFLGLSFGANSKPKEAMMCYQKAISIDPDDALAHYGLGVVYLHPYLNDIDSALKQYKILKKLDTEKANILFDFIYSE